MNVDITFNMNSDSNGGDPDSKSPTLRSYHKYLWSKPLPNGEVFELSNRQSGSYLYHKSDIGEFHLGSDAITHSYINQKRKEWLTVQIIDEVRELFDIGSTIGAYTLFPNKKINGKHTINQARGVISLIDDRFDLTLECIRLFYLNRPSPLYDTLFRYKTFFNLFVDFEGYVNFFLLNDLINDNGQIKFYLPFDDFKSKPGFSSISDYLTYKSGVMNFINRRNRRILNYSDGLISTR